MRNILIMAATSLFIAASISTPALAQSGDEIIVTAMKRAVTAPGIFLEKKGDYLLLEVSVENDSREVGTRLKEIEQTIVKIIKAAESQPDIELSVIDDNDFVRPLKINSFKDGIQRGNRPDTSVAYLKVKTDIPEKVEDSYKLATMLATFIDSIEEVGRTDISTNDEVAVSVVDPYQYRGELSKKIIAEINATTKALGPDYRVVLKGMDKGMSWTRSGDLNLAFFIPYSYEILPTSLAIYVDGPLYEE